MLYSNDDGELKTFRASQDKYPYKTNFSDLPEIINSTDKANGCKDHRSQGAQMAFNQSNLLKHELIYDEELQVKLLKQRNLKVFKGVLNILNRYPLKKEHKQLCNVFEDKMRL